MEGSNPGRARASFITACLLGILITSTHAAEPHQSERQGVLRVRQLTAAQFPYLAITPAEYQRSGQLWPLIVFLHGSEQRGRDVNLLKVNGPPKYALDNPEFPFVVVAPQLAPGKLWEPDAVAALVKQVMSRFRVDRSRVYLTGISTGGYGTWATGLKHPERFAAIVPVAGGGDTVLLKHAEGAYLEAVRSLAVWAFHGGSDSIVSPNESQRMVAELQRLGAGNTRVTVFSGAPHDIWDRVYNDPALYAWLLQQQR